MDKNKAILLLGSYGQTNLGDDLLMFNYLDWLINEKKVKNIFVNANEKKFIPKTILEIFPNIHIQETYKTSAIKWLRIINNIDVVIYGGGTIYKELYGSTGRKKYAVIFRMLVFNTVAKVLKKDIYNLNIGIGSIKTRIGRSITGLGIKLSTITIFRDKESYDYAAKTLNVSKDKICLANDGIFLSDKWQVIETSTQKRNFKKVIGLNLLSDIPDWIEKEKFEKEVIKFINNAINLGYYFVFMPFQYDFNKNNDKKYFENNILTKVEDKEGYSFIETITPFNVSRIFSGVDVFIGMRFHSLLISIIEQVPFIALEYDTKCTRLIKQINYPYSINLSNLNSIEMLNLLKEVESNSNKIKRRLKKDIVNLRGDFEPCFQKVII